MITIIFVFFHEYVYYPTPLIEGNGSYIFRLHVKENGGIMSNLRVGFFDIFEIGISAGIYPVIGQGPIELYGLPQPEFKVILADEKFSPLVIAGGYTNQGEGLWHNGFSFPSPGFYLTTGKDFTFFSSHFLFGIGFSYNPFSTNYQGFTGTEVILSRFLSLHMELVYYEGNFRLNSGLSFNIERNGIKVIIEDMENIPIWDWGRSLLLYFKGGLYE